MVKYTTSGRVWWMDIKQIFACNLRRLRQARKLSQEALAHEAGLDRTYISALERCVYAASITTVADLSRALGVEPNELLIRSRGDVKG